MLDTYASMHRRNTRNDYLNCLEPKYGEASPEISFNFDCQLDSYLCTFMKYNTFLSVTPGVPSLDT
jgi:hypothetical protein